MRLLEQVVMVVKEASSMVFNNIDLITSVSCLIAAVGCIYLSAVILKERTPLVDIQRWSLGGMALTLLANSLYEFPEWALVGGHRPTGALVDFMLMINVLVMAVRGSIMYQPHRERTDRVARLD